MKNQSKTGDSKIKEMAEKEIGEKEVFLRVSNFDLPNSYLGLGVSYNFYIFSNQYQNKVGQINLRLGESPEIYYLGHIGYHIDQEYQGHNYGYWACRELIPLLHKLKVQSLVITTDVDNIASRRICEKLGTVLESIVSVPEDIKEKYVMDQDKCRYIWQYPYSNTDD